VRIEPSHPPGDAPCPNCGHLLWFRPGREREQQPRILIIDDNETDLRLWREHLREVDCHIESLMDGKDALERAEQFPPDLIVLNVTLPTLSGIDVCRILKQGADTRRIMVLLVTAALSPGDIERAVAAGTDDFLSKPVDKSEFVKRVGNLLALKPS
jgi:two-component system alkaline phosphatase synthesis response regulator PhoP